MNKKKGYVNICREKIVFSHFQTWNELEREEKRYKVYQNDDNSIRDSAYNWS